MSSRLFNRYPHVNRNPILARPNFPKLLDFFMSFQETIIKSLSRFIQFLSSRIKNTLKLIELGIELITCSFISLLIIIS